MNLSRTEMKMLVPNLSSLFPVVGGELSFLVWSPPMLWSPPLPAFSGILPDFLPTSLTVLSSLQAHLHLFINCESFLLFHPLLWSHPLLWGSLCITTTCRWPTDLKLPPRPFLRALDPHAVCLLVDMSETPQNQHVQIWTHYLFPRHGPLPVFHISVYRSYVCPVKLETQDSSLLPPPFLPTSSADLFSGSLGFYFCKSAYFFHPHLYCPGPLLWPPICCACIYLYFCLVCFPHCPQSRPCYTLIKNL